MFFQFSPPVKKIEKKVTIVDDSEEVSVLSLAPFTQNPKIFFNNVTVGKTAVRKLIIKNPQSQDLQITARNDFPEEIIVNLSWWQHIIEKNGEVTLELTWTPQSEGSWRHMLNLSDGKRHHRDIPIAFKSITTKKCTNKGKKAKQLPKFKVKSPVRNYAKKKSPIKRAILPNITNIPSIIIEAPVQGDLSGKENRENDPKIAALSMNFDNIQSETNSRRSTYTVQSTFTEKINISINSDSVCSDSLETVSPLKNVDVIETKLQSVSFMFSPVISQDVEQKFSPHTETFNTSTPHTKQELICSSVEKNKTYDLIPNNISSETYVKGNISAEMSVKANISSSTYVKDSSFNGDITNIELSPIHQELVKPIKNVEINLWQFERPNLPLDCIKEESCVSENCISPLKRKSNYSYHVTPHKRATRLSDWSLTGGSLRFSKKTTGLSISRENNQTGVSSTDIKELALKNPFLLAAVENVDPFMTSTLYFSEEWMNEQQENFKKWLNALLTPPAEFDMKEEHPVDFTKIWNECKRKKEVRAAPTREMVSNKYHTNAKLNMLRKAALVLYRTTEIKTVLAKVAAAVDNNKLTIRQDRDVHLDLSLQSEIMSIFLSYNPLWLRIGLETVYNETIPMASNSDLTALTCFLLERFFKSPHLLKKYKSIHAAKYNSEIKKFILKKFFSFVYFLDQAKTKKLIQHDPCLFFRGGEIKESKEALLKFARETLCAVGDVTKYLKYFGYVVTHKQTYIDEFNYAVTSLGADLRDGVRLTRVMEIILLKNGLSENLRVPAISRLQKVHNMKIVFDSLENAGFQISEDISPKDIVNGHKEKTLSFLWQIVYKFQAPLMIKSASTIQKWWRSGPVLQKREALREIYERRDQAARKIQTWYRNHKLSGILEEFVALVVLYKEYNRVRRAATKIQSYVKMYLVRKKYVTVRKSIIKIQQQARKWLEVQWCRRHSAAVKIQSYVRMFIAKRTYQKLKFSVLLVEERYLANKMMKLEKERFESLKYATILIQNTFRANRLCRQVRGEFLDLKAAVIIVQQRFRANIAMRTEQKRYKELKNAVITVQGRYRAKLEMKKDRLLYQTLQYSVILIQRHYRAKIAGRIERNRFLQLKKAVLTIQQRFRANIIMKKQRDEFAALKKATLVIQRRYRANLAMRREMVRFKTLRHATVLIQRRYRAIVIGRMERHRFMQLKKVVVIIQQRYRATITMKKQQQEFITLRKAALAIQRRYRAKLSMRRDMLSFNTLRQAAVSIQQRYRANIIMKKQRDEFSALKKATLVIQRRYRAKLAMRREMLRFKTLRHATVLIQRRYRATITMKNQQQEFTTLRKAALVIQRRYRANIIMKKQRDEFAALKKATLVIQRRYRAKLAMRREMLRFKTLRHATVLIQRRYRAIIIGRMERQRFTQLKKVVVIIQHRYRATITMKKQQQEFIILRRATLAIQRRYRAKLLMRREMLSFNTLRQAAVSIQQRYRANIIMKKQRDEFAALKKATLVIQKRYRAKLAMRREMLRFNTLRQATVLIQRRYRAIIIGRMERHRFTQLKKVVVIIQQRYRATITMKNQQQEFTTLRKATLVIQRRYRANIIMKKQREEFTALKNAAVVVQRRYRANVAMRRDMLRFKMLQQACIQIQRCYRARVTGEIERECFKQLKWAVVFSQQRYRCNILMKRQREEYRRLRNAVIVVQRRYRATLLMRRETVYYKTLQRMVIFIQRHYRAKIIGRTERNRFTQIKNSVLFIQQRYRATITMKKQREEFLRIKRAIIVIQRRYRSLHLMRREKMLFQQKKHAALKIQRFFRSCMRNKSRNEAEFRVKAAIVIQKYVRRYLVRKEYAQYLTPEAINERRVRRLQNRAAVKIQAAWRGYRSRLVEKAELSSIRERSKRANENAASQNTLRSRCTNAVQLLASNPTLFEIIRALEDLEFITRRCKETCLRLSILLSKQLYLTITSTNRSPPHMKACNIATHILINFWKYPPSRPHCWKPEYIELLVMVMLHWCDKEEPLFPTLCTLFWLICHTPEYKKVILQYPNFNQKIEKIESLCIRKEHMVTRSNSKSTFFSVKHNLPLPSLTPDWGLEYKTKPKVFSNSSQALRCLLKFLRD